MRILAIKAQLGTGPNNADVATGPDMSCRSRSVLPVSVLGGRRGKRSSDDYRRLAMLRKKFSQRSASRRHAVASRCGKRPDRSNPRNVEGSAEVRAKHPA